MSSISTTSRRSAVASLAAMAQCAGWLAGRPLTSPHYACATTTGCAINRNSSARNSEMPMQCIDGLQRRRIHDGCPVRHCSKCPAAGHGLLQVPTSCCECDPRKGDSERRRINSQSDPPTTVKRSGPWGKTDERVNTCKSKTKRLSRSERPPFSS